MNPKREGAGATQSGRVASWERRKVKLWEEPDQKLVTDDVRGGSYSFWAEWHIRRRAHPSGYYKLDRTLPHWQDRRIVTPRENSLAK